MNPVNGRPAIVPGKPDESELWKRLIAEDEDVVMPPPSTHKTLKPEQRQLIYDWILQGAIWGDHWSFEAPVSKPIPESVASIAWVKSPIDAWAFLKMNAFGLEPAPAVDAATLCRRLHLDLIGIPPTPDRVQRFVQEHGKGASASIERLVDELEGRPEYGEHWARMWLDLARYADTKGYEKDLGRDMWPYRDWVVTALNQDMPFDQFTTEQLAGDLLPQATESQRIATAFHRATLSNDEGGTDDEEFRVAAIKDRIDTTVQVWMGLTMGCAKCHSHKYDPISIEDYYRFYAIFNQTEDADRYDDEPKLSLPSFAQQKKLLTSETHRAELQIQMRIARDQGFEVENKRWVFPKIVSATSEQGAELKILEDQSILAGGHRPEKENYLLELELQPGTYRIIRIEALTVGNSGKVLVADSSIEPEVVGRNPADPNFVLSEFTIRKKSVPESESNEPLRVISGKASAEQDGWPIINAFDNKAETGWAIGAKKNEPHWALLTLEQPLVVEQPTSIIVSLSQQFGGGLLMQRVRISMSDRSLEESLPTEPESLVQAKKSLADFDQEFQKWKDSIPKLPILRELPVEKQRVTKVHNRGSFLDQTTIVHPSLLSRFDVPTLKKAGTPPTRLAVAQWLVSPENPLTARVMVNRVWAQLFGRGIVETEEDFGSQGSLPSHPELLDFLAVSYRDTHAWSLKKLLKQIVLSSTYQQSFLLDDSRRAKDPRNTLLSRGPRMRLSAESVRDNALAIAGLLSDKQGGPPVMPPQPDGLWRSTYSGAKWATSSGADRYRRGIYTYWKRTTPYPSMETFDSSTREVCQIRRITTNTPLQALVTLNDPVYVEAASSLAYRLLHQRSETKDRIDLGFLLATSRSATVSEIATLSELLAKSQSYFQAHPGEVTQTLSQCHFDRNHIVNDIDLAAWSIVTTAILNLDEVLTK